MKRLFRILFLFALLAVISACTTQKSRKDQSLLSRLYHNTTAHYNGYFNADEILTASFAQLDEQFQDNYNKILPVYKHLEADNPQAVGPDLDEAIKKVSVVVNLHRQSVWTDDCYLLLGQAQYLKKDYEGAEETFRYLVAEFDPANENAAKKQAAKSSGKSTSADRAKAARERELNAKQQLKQRRKEAKERSKTRKKERKEREKAQKEYNRLLKKNKKLRKQGKPTIAVTRPGSKEAEPAEEITDLNEADKPQEEAKEEPPAEEPKPDNPSNYFLKHRPVYQEGVLWLARTLIERDNHDAALRYIAQLESDPATFKDIHSELATVKAHLFLDQKKYEAAVAPLELAVEQAGQREKKARYAYILAQIHQEAGRTARANEVFALAEKYTQDYEMAFSAQLNQVLTSNASVAQAQSELEKMLKDTKNDEFQDQIYYTLGEIALNAGQREEGIAYLQKSLQSGLRNPTQRTESYYRLAELYFEDEMYIPAKNYFDSTRQVMLETDERYQRVNRLADNLAEIAENLEIVHRQDSLLRISAMGPEERRELAAQIKLEQDEARRRQIAAQASQTAPLQRPAATNALQQESTFFAYDERNLKRGKRDFARKWGERPLQDNWRRSTEIGGGPIETEEQTEEVIAGVLTDEDLASILGDVPDSEEEKSLANLRIQEAMYTLGALYRDRLENHHKTIEILEELNSRYPGSNKELDAWYLLYLSHTALNNNAKARDYYDKIIQQHPNSKYALVLQDPNYADKLRNKELEISLLYDEAYSAFTQGAYQDAYSKVLTARERFGAAHSLQPKFALLSALCIGNLQGRDAYVRSLTEVVAKYPNTDEQRRAREILRLLGEWRGTLPGEEKIKDSEFAYEPEQLHYIVITFEDEIKLNDQKAKISDFNRKYFDLEKLRISNIFLGTDINKPIIVIRRFKNRDDAMRYYDATQKNAREFIDPAIRYNIFAITQNNYREVLKAKTLEGYQGFFQSNYLD